MKKEESLSARATDIPKKILLVNQVKCLLLFNNSDNHDCKHKILSIFCIILLLTIAFTIFPLISVSAITLEETISRRQSTHAGDKYNLTLDISNQQLSKVLWAAYGYTQSGNRSVPTIGGNYSLLIYILNATGSYRYVPENSSIVPHNENITKETIRSKIQNWPSDTSAVLVVVWNKTRMSNQYFAAAEAGCLVQNVYLQANVLHLGTCCVGGIDSGGVRRGLGLTSNLVVLLIMPLGYPKQPYPPASPNLDIMNRNLPPVQYSTITFEEAINFRRLVNNWSSDVLSLQELSQLLWAAYGSANTTHRTTPSAYGIYPLTIYVLNSTGVYRYVPEIEKTSSTEHFHYNVKMSEEDKRQEVADAYNGQTWVADAPVIFMLAYNSSFNVGDTGDSSAADSGLDHEFIEIDVGLVIQNIFLEATAWNISTNVIGDGLEDWNGTGAQKIRNILNLNSNIIPLYVMPIGYSSEHARAKLEIVEDDRARVFEVSGLNVIPNDVEADDDIVISVKVSNMGDTSGNHSFDIRVDGIVVYSSEVSLIGRASKIVRFTVSPTEVGIHTVDVENLTESFIVRASSKSLVLPEFEVSNLTVSPSVVQVGGTITISVNVTNIGKTSGEHDVELRLDGVVIETKLVTLNEGDCIKLSFNVTSDKIGSHIVVVEELSRSFEVTSSTTFSWTYSIIILVLVVVAAYFIYARRG